MKLAVSGGAVLGRIIPKKVAVPIGPLPGASRAAQTGALPKGAFVPKPFRGPILAGCAIILCFFFGLAAGRPMRRSRAPPLPPGR